MRKTFLVVGLLATLLTVLILVLILATQGSRTPPPAVTGLIATDASYLRHGQIDLFWSPSDAEDFAYYAVYATEAEITDVTELTPIGRINDRTDVTYQITKYRVPGLRLALFAFMEDNEYWFAVTAVDVSGNESKVGTSVSATIEMMPPAPPAPTVFIRVAYTGFDPATVTVPVGTTVSWTNVDDVINAVSDFFPTNPHSVTSDTGLFHGELANWGVILTYTFTEVGVFGYYDQFGLIDPVPTGTIIVVEQAVEEPGPAGV